MIGLLAAGAAVAAVPAVAVGAYHPNSPLFGPVIGRGSRKRRRVYLTFDDGPNPSATEAILDALAAGGRIPAAFFMVGRHVRLFPAVARRVAEEGGGGGHGGHEIGNHTEHHVKLHVAGPVRIRAELQSAHHAIVEATGRRPRAFRAPHGYRNPFVASAVRRFGYRVFGWTFGVWDSDRPAPEEIRRRVREQLRPGAIILLHDGDGYDPNGDRTRTARALPGIIADARALGYEFASLGELCV